MAQSYNITSPQADIDAFIDVANQTPGLAVPKVQIGSSIIAFTTVTSITPESLSAVSAAGYTLTLKKEGGSNVVYEAPATAKDGKTPVLETGETETLEAGQPATSEVVADGTDGSGNPRYKVNFGIPQGAKGAAGAQGPKGDTGAKGDAGAAGPKGDPGAVFTPAVDASGNLSWTNNGDLDNPDTVNIKGPKGDTGARGPQGEPGTAPDMALYQTKTDAALETTDKTVVGAINELRGAQAGA